MSPAPTVPLHIWGHQRQQVSYKPCRWKKCTSKSLKPTGGRRWERAKKFLSTESTIKTENNRKYKCQICSQAGHGGACHYSQHSVDRGGTARATQWKWDVSAVIESWWNHNDLSSALCSQGKECALQASSLKGHVWPSQTHAEAWVSQNICFNLSTHHDPQARPYTKNSAFHQKTPHPMDTEDSINKHFQS